MPLLHVVPPALAPFVPFHTGHLHLVADSVLGVAVGLVVVGLYVAALRWAGDGSGGSREGGRRSGERRSNR
ncbi:MAG: hypothetical protein ABEJ26_06835 [Halosimplex sp.]